MSNKPTIKASQLGPEDAGKRVRVEDQTGRLIAADGVYVHRPHPTLRPRSSALPVGYLSVQNGPPLLVYPDDTVQEV